MEHRRGFTLVELLVVIVILGIITGISIPLIRNIQESNEMRKYTTYMDSIKQSAKLYTNSYQEDMFGHHESGCATITYKQLEEKGLLKDIMISDVSCNSENTFVKVVKLDNHFSYSVSIGCGSKKADGTVNLETILPEGGIPGMDICHLNSNANVYFTTIPVSSAGINYQRRNVVLNMTSHTGFHEDINISYGFIDSNNKPANNTNEPSLVDGWKKLNINYIGGNEQKKEIEVGNSITLSTDKIQTPSNHTGDYYLVLKINQLKDLSGREWNEASHLNDYVYLGPYRIDNTKPVFDDTSTVVSNNADYNSLDPKLKISVTDNYSTAGDLRMCYAYDNDTCSKKVKDIKNKTGYVSYDGNAVLSNIKDKYDGSSHTIYVTVGDAAGNYETKTFTYTIAKRYTLTYDSKSGSECTPKSVTFNIDKTVKWGTLCTSTRNGFLFRGWKDSSGNVVTADTIATSDIKVTAQWVANETLNQTYGLSNECYEYNVEATGKYHVELWGAQGGSDGGEGGYTAGDLEMISGEKYWICVGGAGQTSINYDDYNNFIGIKQGTCLGGFNGGGNCCVGWYGGGTGGGATDIRFKNNDYDSRIMVAGGGGGDGALNGNGGNGGGIIGGYPNWGGQPGTQTAGGAAGGGEAGKWGEGGSCGRASQGVSNGESGGSGGGGYYGGGGGSSWDGGGGGSSYASGHPQCTVHSSNKQFTNIQMTQGGRKGNGAAKITFIE